MKYEGEIIMYIYAVTFSQLTGKALENRGNFKNWDIEPGHDLLQAVIDESKRTREVKTMRILCKNFIGLGVIDFFHTKIGEDKIRQNAIIVIGMKLEGILEDGTAGESITNSICVGDVEKTSGD
jgi:hypothetical protein